MQQFSLVYNNLFVFLEPVDEPWPTYGCGQLMQGSSIVTMLDRVSVLSPIAIDILMDTMARDRAHMYLFFV